MSRLPAVIPALFAAIVLTLGGCNRAPEPRGEKIVLKLNLPKGEKRTLIYDTNMQTEVSQGRQSAEVDVGMGMDLAVEIVDVDEQGVHTMKVTYDAARMRIQGGPVNIDYDSSSGNPPPPAAAAFGQLVGQSLTIKTNPDGSTQEVEGIDELAEAVAEKQGPAAQAQTKSQLESMKSSFGQMMATFPDHPVDIRDTWTVSQTMEASPGMPMTLDATYTLYDRQNGEAIIKVDGKISSKVGIAGTLSGTLRVDEQTGWTNAADLDMEMSGTVQGSTEMELDGTVTVRGK